LMSLEKAIKHGKERRKPYRGSARFDLTCRPHGGGHAWQCKWCEGNRLMRAKRASIRGNDETI
jgi:hypothetical protein